MKVTEVTAVFYRGFHRYFGVCDIKEIIEEMKMNYVYEDEASSLHPKRVSCGILMRLIYLVQRYVDC